MTDIQTTSAAAAALPATTAYDEWTDAEKAMVEAMGLVFVHTYGPREGELELAPRATVEKFFHAVRTSGLDPLMRQIYCIGRLSKGRVDWSIQTSIDGFRVIAERTEKYSGQSAPEWLTSSGEWTPVFIKGVHGDHPLAARILIYRSDWDHPAVGIATWDEYVQTKRDGTPTAMWLKMGPTMIAKCAEALGFRKGFPQNLSGLYTGDEMAQALNGDEQAQLASERIAAPQPPAAAPEPQQPVVVPESVAPILTPETPTQPSETIPTVQQTEGRNWKAEADAKRSADAVLELFNEAKTAGALGQLVRDDVRSEDVQLRIYLRELGEQLRNMETIREQGANESMPGGEPDGEPSMIWESGVNPETGEVQQ